MLTALMWIGIVIGSLIALAVLAFVAMIVWNIFTGSSPKGVEFDVNAPVLLSRDEAFTMTVVVRNLLDTPRTLRSLDFDDSLLKAFIIERHDPPCGESSSGWGTTTYQYGLPIAARTSVTLTLACRAVQTGEFSGDVMVYVDQAHWKFASKVFRIVVR